MSFARFFQKVKSYAALSVTALLLLFAAVNHEWVKVSFFPFPYHIELPAFLLILLCFALGMLVGSIVVSLKKAEQPPHHRP